MMDSDVVNAVMVLPGVRGMTINPPTADDEMMRVYIRFAPWTRILLGWRYLVLKHAERKLGSFFYGEISVRSVGWCSRK